MMHVALLQSLFYRYPSVGLESERPCELLWYFLHKRTLEAISVRFSHPQE